MLSQLKQTKFFFHFQQEIFCLLFLKELSRKGFKKYRHVHSQVTLNTSIKFSIIITTNIEGKFLTNRWCKAPKANHKTGTPLQICPISELQNCKSNKKIFNYRICYKKGCTGSALIVSMPCTLGLTRQTDKALSLLFT